jgi:hypothetical protein
MESQVKEYQELYSRYVGIFNQFEECQKPIEQLEAETEKLRKCQDDYDYTDKNVVIRNMDNYIGEAIKNRKIEIHKEIQADIIEISDAKGKIYRNFLKVIKWLSKKTVDKIILRNKPDVSQEMIIKQAYSNTKFNVFFIINKVLAYVFRLDFLLFFPKALRILTALIFWGIILIPKIVKNVYVEFDIKYRDYMFGLKEDDYEKALEIIKKELLFASVFRVLLIVGLIFLINLVVYYVARYYAKSFMVKNQVVYLAISDPERFKKIVFDYKLSKYMGDPVSVWNKEIKHIMSNGLVPESEKDITTKPLRPRIVEYLKKEYDDLAAEILIKEELLDEYHKKLETICKDIDEIVSELNAKEKGVVGMIGDSEHNNGVLSPYVAVGFSNYENNGVKELVSFKHNYKPILICYDEDSEENGERFRKNIEKLIDKFMAGFFGESTMDIIDMWLVDFEGLHFPESRTKGMMKVIRTQQELQSLYSKLHNTRRSVDSLADGKIATINPIKLSKRENPIKYNIVFFIGVDYATMDQETVQLFIRGENFGFLPILFMSQIVSQNLSSEENSARPFLKVLKKIKDTEQVYEYEGILNKFKFDILVSNQKKEVDEKLCVNKILSFKELLNYASSSDGIAVDDEYLYVDTFEIDKETYNILKGNDAVRFFTINGLTPSFVTADIKQM